MSAVPYWLKNITNYVAPTIFKKAGVTVQQVPRWAFYNTFDQAKQRYLQLAANAGGSPVAPNGVISITTDQAETIGINCDFYIPYQGAFYNADYKHLKAVYSAITYFIVRMYTPGGLGPVYIVAETTHLGIAATQFITGDPARLDAFDQFYREVQLAKYRYNALAAFLNEFSKKTLSPTEQQIYNEGSLQMQSLSNAMRTIDGIELYFSANGQIGFLQLLLIAAIIIFTAAAAWTIAKCVAETQKTKRINDSYQVTEWLIAKKAEIAANNSISEGEKQQIFKNIDDAQRIAAKIANDSTKDSPGLFGNLATIMQWGVIGYLGYLFLNKSKKA